MIIWILLDRLKIKDKKAYFKKLLLVEFQCCSLCLFQISLMPENGREINSFEVEYLETVTKKSIRWVTEIYMSTVQYDMAVVQLMCPMGAATGDTV